MREALFLKKNREKWASYERTPADAPDELAERFIELTDDLSYARTFYPASKTVQYLNGLASTFHLRIYANRKEKKGRFTAFWREELPLIMARRRRHLGYAFVLFMIFVMIGVLSARLDDEFVRLILGDNYVDMTRENIEKGDPFGVYKSQDPLSMFLSIAFNNIFVACRVFVMGLIGGVGTVFALFQNGVMLGSFEYYFFSRGIGPESILVVFIHGTLEISAIIVAGAAGMVLGAGILFPGTYSRRQSTVMAARDGLKMLVGLMPVFLLAAFFEGYVTRHTGMPVWLSLSILVASLVFVIGYFVVYPARLSAARKSPAQSPSVIISSAQNPS
jgi:uncharacterized membrane protein SpoIIM required for sporulation